MRRSRLLFDSLNAARLESHFYTTKFDKKCNLMLQKHFWTTNELPAGICLLFYLGKLSIIITPTPVRSCLFACGICAPPYFTLQTSWSINIYTEYSEYDTPLMQCYTTHPSFIPSHFLSSWDLSSVTKYRSIKV